MKEKIGELVSMVEVNRVFYIIAKNICDWILNVSRWHFRVVSEYQKSPKLRFRKYPAIKRISKVISWYLPELLCSRILFNDYGHFQTLKWEGVHYDSNLVEVTYVCAYKENIRDCYKTEMFSKYEMAKDTNCFLWMNKILGKKKKTD